MAEKKKLSAEKKVWQKRYSRTKYKLFRENTKRKILYREKIQSRTNRNLYSI